MERPVKTSHYVYQFHDREGKKTTYSCYPNQPPCTYTQINEPNLELMAKGFRNLYYKQMRKEIQKQIVQE